MADTVIKARQLFEALLYGFQKSSLIITIDSTESPLHLCGYRVSEAGKTTLSHGNYAPRMTSDPHERALLRDDVAGRSTVEHNGWPNGQKTVDDETLSGNC